MMRRSADSSDSSAAGMSGSLLMAVRPLSMAHGVKPVKVDPGSAILGPPPAWPVWLRRFGQRGSAEVGSVLLAQLQNPFQEGREARVADPQLVHPGDDF